MAELVLPAKIPSHNTFRPSGHPKGRHSGEDYGWREGDDIFAAHDGVVESVYDDNGYNQGWGNRVVIKHAGNVYTTYNHLAPGQIYVKEGQKVKAKQVIGRQGQTGKVTGKHLHFELEIGGRGSQFRVDPAPYYKKVLPGTAVVEAKPASLRANQRKVRKLGSKSWLNGRADATTKAAVKQRLEPGTIANFDAWKYGEKVTVDGVTSNVWFRGAYKKNWFAAAGLTSQSTAGLKQIKPIIKTKPKATKKNYFKTPASGQYFYKDYNKAYRGAFTPSQVLPPGKTYTVLENPGGGPIKIKVPGEGNVWVGTRNHPAKIVKI